jgi:ribosomal protein L7/L12
MFVPFATHQGINIPRSPNAGLKNRTVSAAQKYFRSELSSHFQWADHGRELCWCDGMTIAFHEEIATTLDRLADGSFADFSTIALAMATLRGSWPTVAAKLSVAVAFLKLSPQKNIRDAVDHRRNLLDLWPETLRKLSLMTKYAETHSLALDTRAELIALWLRDFESGFGLESQKTLVEAFQAGLSEDVVSGNKADETMISLLLPESVHEAQRIAAIHDAPAMTVPRIFRLIRIANSLADHLPADTIEGLHSLVKTGIPDTVRPPEETLLDQRTQTRGLLNQLMDDSELGGVARLAKQLIAAITLPRSLSEPDELQMGGVSDISNRGSLDKLLLSELAHDDLTLAVRLALNEALYLRRESPPSPQIRTRSVLIDLSLPLWGIPRLYATAAAMALHATSDKLVRINCFRSGRDAATATVLTTREGLADHLAALEPTEHPGASLESFFLAVESEPATAEPVLITTSDVLASDGFRQALEQFCISDLWLIVLERDGRLKVLQKTRQGTSVRKQLQLPLDEILSPQAVKQVKRNDVQDDLPAIFQLQQFPLLLSHQTRIGWLWTWGNSAVSISDDGRLMHWTEKGLGAREMATGLPVDRDCRFYIVKRSDVLTFELLACPSNGSTGTLIIIDALRQQVRRVNVDHKLRAVDSVWRTDAALLIFGLNGEDKIACSAFETETGTCLGSRTIDDDLLLRIGRCGKTKSQGFCVLNWVGGQTQWMLQRLPDELQQHRRIVEVQTGKFLAINRLHQLIDPDDSGRFSKLMETVRAEGIQLEHFTEVSAGGDVVVIACFDIGDALTLRTKTAEARTSQSTGGLRQIAIDLKTNSRIPDTNTAAIEYERAFQKIRQRTPHYRFARIGTDSQRLLLKDAGGARFQIYWNAKLGVRLERAADLNTVPQFVEFQPTPFAAILNDAKQDADSQAKETDDETWAVVLMSCGENKISVIKSVREATGAGLKEAKDLVETTPRILQKYNSAAYAETVAAKIKNAGGTCTVVSRRLQDKRQSEKSWSLQKAEWENGSKAWLDARGLLHLKSANRANPEITLVMRDGTLSGWLSSGEVFGDDYHCGKDPTSNGLRRVTAEVAWSSAIRPFIESVPWNFHFTSDTTQTGNTALSGY